MVTAEDTGALDLRQRRQIESEFKKDIVEGRKVDVVIATPTLELGVDIGDLLSVGLFKAPPSPANYTQRIGRAGRKEKISFNNTFLFSTPIDKLYFNDPEKLIKGDIEPPLIDLENTHILQRHINSLILEQLLVNSFEKYPYFMKGFNEDSKTKILTDIDKLNTDLLTRISLTLKDFKFKQLSENQIKEMIESFKMSISYSIDRFNTELSNYEVYLDSILKNRSDNKDTHKWERVRNIEEQIDKLDKESFVSYLMDMNVLPRYAFPGILVDIRDDWGYEKFGARARNNAITEYAPTMEVYLKKKIYKSIGVDLNI
jgi:superfamily II DNA/RNA helicase